MNSDSIKILDIEINKISMQQCLTLLDQYIKNKNKSQMVVTPNAEMVIRAGKDPELARILNKADLSVPDGAGILLASKLLGNPIQERVAGFDLMIRLLEQSSCQGYSVYLLGGSPGIAEKAVHKIRNKYKGIRILGCHHGYLDEGLKEQVIDEINQLAPDLLFVGMGVPLQEKFLDQYLDKLKVSLAVTVGGGFDVLAGKVNRAPVWMQKCGLEWFYRLLQEPSRFGRMLALPRFVYRVILQKFSLI